ncbi:transcription elongation factor GreA [Candidatus Curtissbacteria bacterium]|nr:transcription elongation factor GreA [Candidatus Curtissbacteria bacterium]
MKKPIELHVTKEGYANLQNEFNALTERRPGVLTRMVAAREQGDLSENAGYHAAKEELGRIDRRLRELKVMLRFADIIEATGYDTVSFGGSVKVKIDGDEMDYAIVSAIEADPMKGKVSDSSPIGKALLGKKVGEKVNIETPGGTVIYEILEIKAS